jgi:cell division protein FtsZ
MSSTEFDISFDLPKNQSNVIKVIGVGGGGSNAINHMFEQGIKGVDFVVCNTDAQALENSPVPIKLQLGVNLTEGLGAGANPEIGEQAALESFEDLKSMLNTNTKMVFITAGMGGGTGTGAAPIIAQQAKEMGILTVGIVTIPFQFEGKTRNDQAQQGVEKLRKQVDSLIVINNNKLREVYGNLGFKAGFSKADEVLATASRGIAEVITHHYQQNIDLRDAKTVLSNSGTAIMGSSTASGSNRAQEAIIKALDSPLLNDNKITGAKNVLLLIVSGSQEITIDEIGEINDHIQNEAGHSANIIMGVGEDSNLDESISVTIIATGFDVEQQNVIVNTEAKKIIHTLEDEQKVVQDLSEKRFQARSSAIDEPLPKEDKEEKVVHTLFEQEELEEMPEPTNAQEVEGPASAEANTDDFVFVDATNNTTKEQEPVEEKRQVEEEKEQVNFTFDFPINPIASKPVSPSFSEEIEKTPKEMKPTTSKIVHRLEEEPNSKQQTPSTPKPNVTGGVTRYSLDDYMEEEKQFQENRIPEEDYRQQTQIEVKQPIAESISKVETTAFENKNKLVEETNNTEEIDPLENPISQDLIARAAERRKRMKEFNYKFRNNSSIEEIERMPAYKRAGLELEEGETTGDTKLSRTSVNGSSKDDLNFRTNNSFLHDNVD